MTGTGNSLKIAKDIGTALGEFELISIPELISRKEKVTIEGDLIGFIIPVYFGRPPVFFQEFIANAVFGKTAYIFSVLNGGGLFGRALNFTERLFRKKGVQLNTGFTVEMPGTHPYINPIHRKSAKQKLKDEPEKVETIVSIIRKKDRFKPKRRLSILGGIYSLLAFDIPYDLSKKHSMDRHFWINDGCRNCGLCIKICPSDNIYQSKWKPKWRHNCMNCLACYHLCPYKGIELRCEWKMIDMVPLDQLSFRYSNPDLSIQELLNRKKVTL